MIDIFPFITTDLHSPDYRSFIDKQAPVTKAGACLSSLKNSQFRYRAYATIFAV